MKSTNVNEVPSVEPPMMHPASGVYLKGERAVAEIAQEVARLRKRYEKSCTAEMLAFVCELAPFHVARLSQLRRAHAALIRHAEDVLRSSALANMGVRELSLQLDGVVRAIADHDEAEAALLQDVMLTDLGESG